MLRIELYQDRVNGWRWRAVDGSNRIVADGAESYVERANLEQQVDSVISMFRSTVHVVARASATGELYALNDICLLAEYEPEADHLKG